MKSMAASNGPLTRPLSAALPRADFVFLVPTQRKDQSIGQRMTRIPASENTEQRNEVIDETLASQPGVIWFRAGEGPDRLRSGVHFACVRTIRVRFTQAHAGTKDSTVRPSNTFGRLRVNRAAL